MKEKIIAAWSKTGTISGTAKELGLTVYMLKKYMKQFQCWGWNVQQFTGNEWEDVTAELTRKEAQARRKEYQNNQPEYAVRIKEGVII